MVLAKSALLLLAALSTVAAEPQVPGKNQYLPPDPKGYTYTKPNVPFSTPTPFGPTQRPFTPGPNAPYTPGPYNPGPSIPNGPYTPGPSIPNGPYTPGPSIPSGPFTPGPFTPTRPRPTPRPDYPTSGPGRPPFPPPDNNGGLIRPGTRPPQTHDHGHGEDHVHVPGMPYDFNYAVKDDYFGTDYSHNAVSDGDVVTGEYRVALPDGRLQIVRYTADWKTGFHADVQYQGEPRYPDTPGGGAPGSSYGPPGRGRPGGNY